MSLHTRTFSIERDGAAVPVEVDFTFRPGSAASYSPLFGADGGDPDEIEIDGAWTLDGEEVTLTDGDRELIEQKIAAMADDLLDRCDD